MPGAAPAELLEIGDLRLECWRSGPETRDAPTLVLLHEGLGSAAQWRRFGEALVAATGFGVFAYSREGYGASSPAALPRPLDYLEREAELLPRVLDAAGAGACVLVGHSDGASIAALAAAEGDQRIRGVVLIAPHFFVEDATLEGVRRAVAAYETGELRRTMMSRHDDAEGAFRGWSVAWLDPRRLGWTIVGELPRIGVPVLLIQGTEDRYGGVRQAEAAARACGGPITVRLLPGVGHEPQREAFDETLAAVAAFARAALAAR